MTFAEEGQALGARADAALAAAQQLAAADEAALLERLEAADAKIATLEAQLAQQPTTPAPFSTRLAVGVNDTVWERSTTSALDTITVVTRPDGKRVFRAKAGNHLPNSSGSTYARYRAKLPEAYGVAPRGRFRLSGKLRLLTNADHYYSPLRTDNYVGTIKGTTTKVGCSNGSEWRVGYMFYPGNELRIESTHQGNSTLTLWRGTVLPGDLAVDLDLDPKADSTGSWSLTINGVTRTGTGQTVPSTVPVAERVVTRVVTCIDGANRWTDRAVEVEVEEATFTAAQ